MFEPLFDRVLVLEDKLDTVTKGGLVVPDTATQARVRTATVVSVGSGLVRGGKAIPLSVRERDRVLFRMPAGTEIEIDGVVHRLLRESEIFGVLEA
jgi:chaperonin GroES